MIEALCILPFIDHLTLNLFLFFPKRDGSFFARLTGDVYHLPFCLRRCGTPLPLLYKNLGKVVLAPVAAFCLMYLLLPWYVPVYGWAGLNEWVGVFDGNIRDNPCFVILLFPSRYDVV